MLLVQQLASLPVAVAATPALTLPFAATIDRMMGGDRATHGDSTNGVDSDDGSTSDDDDAASSSSSKVSEQITPQGNFD